MTPNHTKRIETDTCSQTCSHEASVVSALKQMPGDEITLAAADFFKAFSDKTRLRILSALSFEELCVCDIATLLNMTQSAISHQLRFLKQMRLVKSRKDGKTVFYSLCDDHIVTILAQGIEHVQEG